MRGDVLSIFIPTHGSLLVAHSPIKRRILALALFSLGMIGWAHHGLGQDPGDSQTAETSAADDEQRSPTYASVDEETQRSADLMEAYSTRVGPTRTLDSLLKAASRDAPDLERARRRIGLGRAAVEGASKLLPYNPQLEGEAGVGLDEVGVDRFELTLKQRVEIAGERGLRIEVAHRRKDMLQARAAEVTWDVHQRVHRLYRLGLVRRRRVRLERDVLEFTQQLFEIARQRFEAGEEPRTSVIVARAEMATARRKLVQVWTTYIQNLRRLGTAVGWTPNRPPQPQGGLNEAQAAPPRAKLLDRALTNDPRLAVLEARRRRARASLDLRQREVWPNPVIGVGYEREKLRATSAENKVRFIVGIPLPLWNRNQGEIGAAQSRINIVDTAIANRKVTLKSRVFAQADTLEAAYRQTRIFERDVLPALEDQLALLQKGFELGQLSLLDVMNARDRLLSVQRQYLAARRQYVAAVSDLEELLGTSIWDSKEN